MVWVCVHFYLETICVKEPKHICLAVGSWRWFHFNYVLDFFDRHHICWCPSAYGVWKCYACEITYGTYLSAVGRPRCSCVCGACSMDDCLLQQCASKPDWDKTSSGDERRINSPWHQDSHFSAEPANKWAVLKQQCTREKVYLYHHQAPTFSTLTSSSQHSLSIFSLLFWITPVSLDSKLIPVCLSLLLNGYVSHYEIK